LFAAIACTTVGSADGFLYWGFGAIVGLFLRHEQMGAEQRAANLPFELTTGTRRRSDASVPFSRRSSTAHR